MMSAGELKVWPQQTWMKYQRSPPLHKWMTIRREDAHKERLNACGNIVIPAMAYYAMHCLQSMWK